jgi:asparagine synthase (glutamine-hydrolysing)
MCGIAGLLSSGRVDPALLTQFAEALHHRGPDDQGVWFDQEAGIGLAHRRLSIVDLSPSGHQPMHSRDGRWVLSYNGEIYNHAELRTELDPGRALPWRGHSDTETLLECISAWGLEPALRKSIGMFALALWDRRERRLHLARDRFGEKPLYYGWVGGDFVFGSELKAIRRKPGFSNPVNREALQALASRAYIPAALTIYEQLYKLLPGHMLSIDAERRPAPRTSAPLAGTSDGLSLQPYWSYLEVVENGLANPFTREEEALEALDESLSRAIRGQAVADVPVGAFLSGGIDSSTVVALYQKHSPGQVRTFTIGFEEEGFNEADHARAVARHLGTEHHERFVTVREAQQVIPLLPTIYDEPFADASQIPTHIVSRFAREQVTVALSGDGGDELFGGYNRHVVVPRLWRNMQRLPSAARTMIGGSLGRLPPSFWDGVISRLPGGKRPMLGAKAHKALNLMATADGFQDVYASFLDGWHGEGTPVLDANGGTTLPSAALGKGHDAVWAMYCDAVTYLPDDILCKVDRAAMAVSLETRVPFLDAGVAATAARIPLSMKIRDGKGKHILRQLLFREAPAELFDRPKAGFGIPVGHWIKGPLRDWAEALLDPRRLAEGGYFDAEQVTRRWREHLAGERDGTEPIWSVLMFQAWQEAAEAPDAAGVKPLPQHAATVGRRAS